MPSIWTESECTAHRDLKQGPVELPGSAARKPSGVQADVGEAAPWLMVSLLLIFSGARLSSDVSLSWTVLTAF